ncbi:MAG TPA: ethanolamine ammonia-lyase reactivating factor EutA [Burkholderiales bacterium]|nr:ethanolamine ammonia-lyase reactivating factor EutA [Burkholderiales bacterium]
MAEKKPHTLADHLYGAQHDHVHEGDSDHDHDHDHDDMATAGPLEENAIWQQDNIQLVSVGIDIGSSGTQVIFSRLHMRRLGEDLSSRYFVVARETLHASPVALTPYQSDVRIDEEALGRIIDEAYQAAGLHPDRIDTGSVILTGEALRKENAQAIGELIADIGGEFVCAAAGHHMEAMLAAYGSGAAKVSHDADLHVLNIDIGGGTTKLALVEHGRVAGTAAIHVGGRLLVVDGEGRITRLDPQGQALARQAGFAWSLGSRVSGGDLDRLAAAMAELLIEAILSPGNGLYLTDALPTLQGIDGVMFSGGVGEYLYGREARDFGDLGRRLGQALRERLARLPWKLLPPGECIRATAFGASEYSVQLSGNTVYVSQPGELLPRRNLQVLQPRVHFHDAVDEHKLAAAIHRHFRDFDLEEGEAEVALALRWRGEPSFERLSAFARGIASGLKNTLEKASPVYLILDGDIAQTLGGILKEDLRIASELLVIDGIALRDFDYVDLGRIRMPSGTVPVTIKSLVFTQDPRMPHEHRR